MLVFHDMANGVGDPLATNGFVAESEGNGPVVVKEVGQPKRM